jgi:hypothetical protein
MERRISRVWKPAVELVERRVLLSLVTDIMAGNHNALINSPKVRALLAQVSVPAPALAPNATGAQAGSSLAPVTASASGGRRGGFVPSVPSIALNQNQGFLSPANPGYNLLLQPTGNATPAEVKRQLFTAVYRGPYIITPGAFSSQSMLVAIRGAGTANTMLHSDIQLRLAVPTDHTLQTTGATVIFDRNLNSNTALGLDLATPVTNVDGRGRPNRITSLTLDVNSSSGTYVEGYAQGVINIHYYPSSKKMQGAIEQGTAVVKVFAQVYSGKVAFILRNSDINP